MFKFFSKSGVLIFSSDSLEETEIEALKYKKENSLNTLEICDKKGKFYKWI